MDEIEEGLKRYSLTPIFTGDHFIDGFLWGRALFSPNCKTTTRASMRITHLPLPLVLKFLEGLEKFAKVEIVDESETRGYPSELLEIHFHKRVLNPGSKKQRPLNSKWDSEFLRGLIYSRISSLNRGHTMIFTGINWFDEMEKICSRFDLPYSRSSNSFLLPSAAGESPIMGDWVSYFEEDEKENFGINENNITFSCDTNSHDSHEEVRIGFRGNRKEQLLSIRGVAEGRFFWFKQELIDFCSSVDIELKLEACLALSYFSHHSEIEQYVSSDDLDEVKDKYENLVWAIENRVFNDNGDNTFDSRIKFALIGLIRWLNPDYEFTDLERNASNMYIKLYDSLLNRNDIRELDFIKKRIDEFAFESSNNNPEIKYYASILLNKQDLIDEEDLHEQDNVE